MARQPMTPEQKAEAAERLRKGREAKKAQDEGKTNAEYNFLQEEVTMEQRSKKNEIEILKEQNKILVDKIVAMQEKMEAMMASNSAQPAQYGSKTEQVHFLWQAEVSDDNVVAFGENGIYGRVVGKRGEFYVPKIDMSRVMDSAVRYYLEKRWLVVLDGLTQEERAAYGVEYQDGEILDKTAFSKMLEMRKDILPIYPKLCQGHRDMVASRYFEGWRNGSPYVSRSIVTELKNLAQGEKEKKVFSTILEEMNEKEAAE